MSKRHIPIFFALILWGSAGSLFSGGFESPTVRITSLEQENTSLKRQIHALKVDHELLEERLERIQKEFESFRSVDLQDWVAKGGQQNTSTVSQDQTNRFKELELEIKNVKQRTLKQYESLIAQLNDISQAIGTSTTPTPSPAGETYTVRPGDTLERIARRYNITIKKLKEHNSLTSDKIIVGRKLKIPAANP